MASLMDSWELYQDENFKNRVEVAATRLGVPVPSAWVYDNLLKVASVEGIANSWASSKAATRYHSYRGGDDSVITDQAILDAVQDLIGGME